jgi:hypothetical protein
MSNLHKDNDLQSNRPSLERLLAVGAEPYWMQDIRRVTRAIEAQRRGGDCEPPARPASPDQAASDNDCSQS